MSGGLPKDDLDKLNDVRTINNYLVRRARIKSAGAQEALNAWRRLLTNTQEKGSHTPTDQS